MLALKREKPLGCDNNVEDIPANSLLTAIDGIGYKSLLIFEKSVS